jgi:predicted TIM-barrel fold metal-dependent hydrolase
MLGIIRSTDFDYTQACFDAYNEMLAEFCAKYPDRLYGVGLLNYWNPEATKDEIAKLKALNYRAMMMPSLPPPASKVFYNSRSMEPMWEAIAESGIPVSFHVGETFDARGLGGLGTTIAVALQPFRRLFALLSYSGILERHPGLKVIFTEGGISWVPSALFDLDRIYRDFESQMNPKLANPPSHY